MTPPCCEKCSQLTQDGGCLSNDKLCARWRRWFHKEWTGIQAAAAAIKDPSAKPKEKPKSVKRRRSVRPPTPQEESKPVRRRRSVCLPRTEED